MTTIEVTIEGKPVYRHKDTRHLSEQEIRELVREGHEGINKNRTRTLVNGHEYKS